MTLGRPPSLLRGVLARLAPGPPTTPKHAWQRGERMARRTLTRAGMRCMGRNVRVGPGEADLVFASADGGTLVVVEVKARVLPKDSPWSPEDAITAHKREKLRAVTRAVARRLRWSGPVRIDVVAVEWRAGSRRATLRHHEGAVAMDGRR